MRTSIPAGAPCRLSVRNTSRPLLLRLLFLICLTAVLLTAGACKRKAEPLSETRFQLNTFVTITLYDNPDKAILEGAFALVKEYEGVFSKTIETREVEVGEETVVVTVTKPGDFVVCNLASLNLGRLEVESEEEIQDVVTSAMRALDNVIDLNFYPVPYAGITNKKYRSVGLGVSGYHHMLAKHKIGWESEEHLKFADKVFEDIAYAAIKASSDLAEERGSYSLFSGSEWESGEYFHRRHYDSERWQKLAEQVREHGMRNAYVMAAAPTSSTSILVSTTAGLDPIMNRFYLEEKKGAILPRVAPDLSPATWWFYKNAHSIDQTWSVRAAAVRQRHIDQAQSFNLWITNEYKMSQLLNLYILADELGVKTIYYVRSRSLDPAECESCSA